MLLIEITRLQIHSANNKDQIRVYPQIMILVLKVREYKFGL
jgi:hypothetical protein